MRPQTPSSASRSLALNPSVGAGKPASHAPATAAAANTHTLGTPLTVDGKTITVVTFRRPKARDMIVIAEALPVLAAMSEKVQAALKASGGDEAQAGPLIAQHMSPDVFRAMVTVASQLGDLGDAALDLDYADLSPIAMGALALMGE
jgi:hypothetical protein